MRKSARDDKYGYKKEHTASRIIRELPDNVVYGKNAVMEALSAEREINKIIISKTNRSDTGIEQIKKLAHEKGVVFQFAGKDKFMQFAGLNHQGVIALISPIKYMELDGFITLHKRNSSVVILDGVEDARNMGAIIRVCVCAGIDGVIIPSRRSCLITPDVEKTSAGAVNHIDIIKVNSLSTAVKKLKDNGWWTIAANIGSEKNYYDIDYCGMNFAIIMGGEHSGISKTLLKMSDFRIKVPMLKEFNSLNVSTALSVIIYESVRQKLLKNEGIKHER